MGLFKRALLAVAIVLGVLVAIVLVGTFGATSRQITAEQAPALDVPREAALNRLAQAVRHRTITTHEG